VANVSRSCSLCHSANAGLFDGSKHKQAFDKNGWPECSKCHGNHAIQKTNDKMLAAGPGALCTDCHRQFSKDNPECEATAAFFHKTITDMDDARNKFAGMTKTLAARGLDVDPIKDQMNELEDTLKKSRSHIHSFSRNAFQQVAAPGAEAVKKADALADKAREEFKFRRLGLRASIAAIGLLMLAIYLKLRRMEKEEGA
jgi:predicted CXXCH cytochrome family protein